MKEQKDNKEEKEKEKKMKTEKKANKKSFFKGERKFYLFTALGCAAAMIAIIVVAVALSTQNDDVQVDNTPTIQQPLPDDSQSGNTGNSGNTDDEQVVVTPEGMVTPVQTVNVLNEYGFYHNTTLNWYYEHTGVDFAAEAGTQVFAVDSGKVESIYKDDLLVGTEITIDHGDGLKSVYRFVSEAEGLKVGDTVQKGEVIATVAEANGEEYKDGAHLHFEMYKDNVNIDPAVYLTLEEK